MSCSRVIIFSVLVLFAGEVVANSSQAQMLERLNQLDQLDRADFLDGIDKANSCTEQREFRCAEKVLTDIKYLMKSGADKKLWKMAQDSLGKARQHVADEERQQREAEQQERWEEERRWAAEQQRERAEAEANRNRMIMGALGSVVIAQSSKDMKAEDRAALMDSFMRDTENGTGTQNFKATADRISAQRQADHNASMQRIRNQQAEERAERERKASEQQQRNIALANQRQADMAQQNARRQQQSEAARMERDKLAAEQQRRDAEAARQEEARQRQLAQARAAEEAKQAADRKVLERQQQLAKEKAEREARLVAEKAEQARARQDYLQQVGQGVRLGLMKCYGEYHIRGTRPRIKPEVVSCVDVHYRARCDSSTNYFARGVAKNFVGMDAGCFGDTYQISAPSCPVEKVVVEVAKATACGES